MGRGTCTANVRANSVSGPTAQQKESMAEREWYQNMWVTKVWSVGS